MNARLIRWTIEYGKSDIILASLDKQIAALQKARALLNGKPAKVTITKSGKPGKKHVLSPEARKKIGDAQKKRWAAQKAKSK